MSFFLGKVIVVLRHPAARNVGGETPLTKGIKASKYPFVDRRRQIGNQDT